MNIQIILLTFFANYHLRGYGSRGTVFCWWCGKSKEDKTKNWKGYMGVVGEIAKACPKDANLWVFLTAGEVDFLNPLNGVGYWSTVCNDYCDFEELKGCNGEDFKDCACTRKTRVSINRYNVNGDQPTAEVNYKY